MLHTEPSNCKTFTKVYFAIHNNNLQEIIKLLQQGLDPNSLVNNYPLIIIAILKGNLELVKLLLRFNADPDIIMYNRSNNFSSTNALKNQYSYTPLYIAIWFGHESIVETLIQHCKISLPEYKDHLGYTLLHKAVQHKHLNIIKILLKEKCDINTRNHLQETPLHTAIINYNLTVKGSMVTNKDFTIIKFLLENKANVNSIDLNLNTPFELALQSNQSKLINLLNHYVSDKQNILLKNNIHSYIPLEDEEIDLLKLLEQLNTTTSSKKVKFKIS